MPRPRYQRRKEDRPAEITEAAAAAFAEQGYDATPVADVAKRAGVSKGLLYLYFRTKEDLFKAVVRSFVTPRLKTLQHAADDDSLSAEAFLRGPFLHFARELPKSRARFLIRLLVAEAHKHPDLTHWYWDNVVSVGIDALTRLVARGVASGEFRASAVERFPQLLVSPVLMSALWMLLFQPYHKLDTDALIEAHLDIVLAAIRRDPEEAA